MRGIQPKYPAAQMRFVDYRVTVEAIVYVNADGSVKTASIARSSGYSEPDAAVLKAAYASTYKPRTVNCKPADGLYLFRADFAP
jgi:TonB family protein